jgi:hypothetical protein
MITNEQGWRNGEGDTSYLFPLYMVKSKLFFCHFVWESDEILLEWLSWYPRSNKLNQILNLLYLLKSFIINILSISSLV